MTVSKNNPFSLPDNVDAPLFSSSPLSPAQSLHLSKNLSPKPPVFSKRTIPPTVHPPKPLNVTLPLPQPPSAQSHQVRFREARLLCVNQKLDLFYGEYPTRNCLAMKKFGRPSRNHTFTSEATFDHVILFLFKSSILSDLDLRTLRKLHPLYDHLYYTLYRFRYVDFRSLSNINTRYASQSEIPLQRRQRFLAAILHYDLHVPSLIHFLGHNYTNEHLDPYAIAKKLENIAPPHVVEYVFRALHTGAPSKFHGHSSSKNFWDYKKYKNHASIDSRPDLVQKALNKEERNNFILPLPAWLARFIPNLHLSPEGIIIKEGKKDRIIFDASFKIFHDSLCPNLWSSASDEPPIWYGSAFVRHLTRIWNLRITYPDTEIYLWDDDVAGAFRLIKYNPYVASAFSAIVHNVLCVPTGQIFGGNTSAQNFEGLAIAREYLSCFFSSQKYHHLIKKHSALLDNIKYSPQPPSGTTFVKATADATHTGVLDINGIPVNTPHHTFVDDNHMADIFPRIRIAQAASIEGLFQILGFPETEFRRSVLSEDKYFEQACSFSKLQLGYLVDTRSMSVSFSPSRLSSLADILHAWATKRKSYSLKEAAKLAGLLEFIASVSTWIRFLTVSLKHGILTALRFNTKSIRSSPRHTSFLSDAKLFTTDFSTIRKKDFAISKLMQKIWNSKKRFHITNALRKELKLLHHIFSNLDTFPLVTPIAHIIDRTPDFMAKGDACLDGAGGFSKNLTFWWFLEWPPKVKERTIKHFIKYYHGVQGNMLSINLLEYVAIIISLAAAATRLSQGLHLSHPHPLLSIFSDNTTAISWTKRAATSTAEGKALARVLTSILIYNPSLGLNSSFVAGKQNGVADAISRMSTRAHTLTFAQLSQTYPILTGLHRFHPSQELLSRIWDALSSRQVHPLDQMHTLGHFSPGTTSG